MTTTSRKSKTRGKRLGPGPKGTGEAATLRWFSEADIKRHVQAIAAEIREARETPPALRGDAPQLLFPNILDGASPRAARSTMMTVTQIASQAYMGLLEPMPEDHVVINPVLNREFISRCRLLGAEVSEFALNKALLNVRKSGSFHRGIDRGTAPALDRGTIDHMGYAAEIAAKFVQLRAIESGSDQPTIDKILCDPMLRDLFDDAAQQIAPGFTAYEYRLAALAYRKSGRASNVRLGASSEPSWEVMDAGFPTLDPDDAPTAPGIYQIEAGARVLFVSATLNLRSRLLAHLAAGERRAVLPPNLWDPPRAAVKASWFRTPKDWKPRRTNSVAHRMKTEAKAMYNLFALSA